MQDDLETILIREDEIRERLDALAAELHRDYQGKDLTLVGVLTGSIVLLADLIRLLPSTAARSHRHVQLSGGTRRPRIRVTKALRLDVEVRDVLVVDDILVPPPIYRVVDILTLGRAA
jgi:hypoxanthine phosphoribosyltransferase